MNGFTIVLGLAFFMTLIFILAFRTLKKEESEQENNNLEKDVEIFEKSVDRKIKDLEEKIKDFEL